MRRPLFFFFAFALIIFITLPARAAMRVTDVDGREVVIPRGASLVKPRMVATNARRVGVNANVTITAGADTDAANNDYRRIQNAINAATPGDTITLSGTFDFTAPFAAAAWALGNDNTASTGDDYGVTIPVNLANITLTATSLGSATIQGPGDLAALDLEGFIYFDGAGDNPDWEISNLQIYDFDMGIGMFNGAGGSDSYNNTVITNNRIRLPNDLNGTVAPGDPLQNIAIHFSFGTNQSITNNTIDIPGNSLSDVASNAASVGMQSNTSGGAIYDGLLINGNTVNVLNAQAALPERIIGIWENAHAHVSDITVSNNTFVNAAPGNDSALNGQRGFRITSHSGAATTVAYTNNSVTGANIGFEWITGSNFSPNQAILMTGGGATGCRTGILIQSNGIAHIETMTITGSGAGGGIHVITGSLTGSGLNVNGVSNSFVSGGSGDGVWIEAGAGAIAPLFHNDLGGNTGFGLLNAAAPSIVAERNWWGNNLAAAVAAEVSGNADFDPWLASGTDVSGSAGFQPFVYATTSGAITTFVGTSGADTGALLAGDPVTMQMAGQTAFTALAQLLNFDIQLGDSNDVFTLGQTGIPTVFDGGNGNDTLAGTNVAQTWNVTGAGSGNIPGAATSFTNVESLRGGTAADAFAFGAAGSLGLNIDGNLGIDSLDNSAIPASTITPTGPGTLDGFMGTATGIGTGFDNINLLVNEPANLSVTKTGPATATTNTQIAYTITVTNGGPNPAVNVSLSDTLPAGTTFVSLPTPAGWSCITPGVGAGGTVTCTRLSMPVGADVFTLTVNAPASPAAISNTATVTSANEGAPGNESATANTQVNGLANLSVTKTGPLSANTNTQIAYTIPVTNAGPDPAVTVQLSDALPAGTTFVSLPQPAGWICVTPTVGAGGNVTCTRASVPVGFTAFTLTINTPATPGPISNTAIVTSANENAPGDESATANTNVNSLADLTITKTAPATVITGDTLTYTITVANGGPNTANNVVVTDTLPAGVTFDSATPSQGTCSGTTTITCTLGTILNGGSATIALAVDVTAAPGATLVNTATVDSDETDPVANVGGTATTAVIARAIEPPIPTASEWALLMLAAALGMFAVVRLRL